MLKVSLLSTSSSLISCPLALRFLPSTSLLFDPSSARMRLFSLLAASVAFATPALSTSLVKKATKPLERRTDVECDNDKKATIERAITNAGDLADATAKFMESDEGRAWASKYFKSDDSDTIDK